VNSAKLAFKVFYEGATVFSHAPCGERDIADARRRTVPPSIRTPSGVLSCYPLVAFSSSKDTLFGVCTLLQRRLKRNGAKGFLRVTKGVLRTMPFVLLAVLGSTIAVSVAFVMYMLVRRWL
jgi:hypothetical protein